MNTYDSAHIKGIVGESITATVLEHECKLKIHKGIVLPRGSKYTEIDMIGINDNGVFLIENKNYSGYILGSYQDETWDVVYNENEIYRLYNPIKQNDYHYRTFINFLNDNGLYDIPVYNYVIFNDNVKGFDLDSICKEKVFTISDFVQFYNLQQFDSVKITQLNISIISNLLNDLHTYSKEIRLVNSIIRTLQKNESTLGGLDNGKDNVM